MWSHYAENHLGVCYGFDIPSGPNTTLVEMKYPDKLKKFDHAALSDRNVLTEMINYAQRHKSQVWEYEQEWRTDVSLNKDEQEAKARGASIFYLPFSEKLKLKKIIIGTRSKITSTQINNALGPMSGCVEIVTARASFREYKIVEQKLSRLKK
ncbi:hypothetical protein TL5118_00160 [Thalassovita autumnalis]|nr:hypothetical protein TL5118_00160 [Thalassovita autumnalis]